MKQRRTHPVLRCFVWVMCQMDIAREEVTDGGMNSEGIPKNRPWK